MSASHYAPLVLGTFIVGLGIGSGWIVQPMVGVILLLVTSSLLIKCPGRTLRLSLILLSASLAGWLYTSVWRLFRAPTLPIGEKVTMVGIVSEPPDIREKNTRLSISPKESNYQGRILVTAPRYPTYVYGDRLKVSGQLSAPESFDGFNYPLYLESKGIYALILRPSSIRLLESNQGNIFLAHLYHLRGKIEQAIQQLIPEPEASFLGGLLLGSQRAIPEEIRQAFRTTGTSHIIAISGANITILLGIILKLLPVYKQRSQLWVLAGVGIFVTLLTGASASVRRGALVSWAGFFLKYKSRRPWPFSFILFCMFVLLLINPLILVADPGFQLSFGAFGGIIFLSKYLLEGVKKWPLTRHLPEILRTTLAETAAATLGTAPLSLALFGQISLLGLIVNPLILWSLPFITLLGLAFILFQSLPVINAGLALILWILLHAILEVIAWFSRFEIGVLTWKVSWLTDFLITVPIIAIFQLISIRRKHLSPITR